jgi:nitrate reductase gamma subunit
MNNWVDVLQFMLLLTGLIAGIFSAAALIDALLWRRWKAKQVKNFSHRFEDTKL